jgi:hypothetical protein
MRDLRDIDAMTGLFAFAAPTAAASTAPAIYYYPREAGTV